MNGATQNALTAVTGDKSGNEATPISIPISENNNGTGSLRSIDTSRRLYITASIFQDMRQHSPAPIFSKFQQYQTLTVAEPPAGLSLGAVLSLEVKRKTLLVAHCSRYLHSSMLHGGFFSAFNRKIIGVYVVYGSSINW